MSEGVSVPCQHATPVADVPWEPIFSDVKFSKESNQGKCHELMVSIQGKESSSVRSQISKLYTHIIYIYNITTCTNY